MDDQLRGMNVNERLFEAGLLDQWDKAARVRDGAAMIELLVRVAISPTGAERIVSTVLANPDYFGY
jgi:hypothetical protein